MYSIMGLGFRVRGYTGRFFARSLGATSKVAKHCECSQVAAEDAVQVQEEIGRIAMLDQCLKSFLLPLKNPKTQPTRLASELLQFEC